MPCLLVLLAMLVPRVVIVFIWLLTDWFGQVFHGALLPLLGFFFLPYTTLAYLAAIHYGGGVTDWWLVLLIVAVIADMGHWGSGARVRRRR
jgi:hypothetical protein